MANRTQCPKCLTIYVITDQQYRKSKGKVRCGNCRVTFNAAFLAENSDASDPDTQPDDKNAQVNTVNRSAKNNSVDSLSSRADNTVNRDGSENNRADHAEPTEPAEIKSEEDNFTSSSSHMSLSENLNPDLSLDLDEEFGSDTLPETSDNLDELALDIQTGHNKDQRQALPAKSSISNKDSVAISSPVTTPSPPVTTPKPTGIKPTSSNTTTTPPIRTLSENRSSEGMEKRAGENEDQELISEVRNLIDEKLIVAGSEANLLELEAEQSPADPVKSKSKDSNVFVLDPKPRFHTVKQWLLNPLLLLLVLGLSIALLYQLWLRQAVPILEDERLPLLISPVIQPLEKKLSEQYQVKLPIRRDLSGLELLSARTEAHPTRYSTTLLKASLINRAGIAQPFPWLELSLSDENGRVIARRALSPDNYLHNNRLENRIKANELRQVTIELLSFPRQAHGFELRILNN